MRLFLLVLVLGLLVYGWWSPKLGPIYTYYWPHILLPLLLVILIQLLCNIFSIIAWTRTSLR